MASCRQNITLGTARRKPTARAPSEFAPRGAESDVLAPERVEALELRITQLEQLLEAQRTLQNRNRLAESQQLRQRLDVLEKRLLSAQDLLPRRYQRQQLKPPARQPQPIGCNSINWSKC